MSIFVGFVGAIAYYEYSETAYFSEFQKLQQQHSKCLEQQSGRLHLLEKFYKEYKKK
ncbi:MAG: hypothetical protein F6K17_01330 [Okeania sp. SIO3C4]|nr:hypothetical protein [Okeania sp. SIO3C4]